MASSQYVRVCAYTYTHAKTPSVYKMVQPSKIESYLEVNVRMKRSVTARSDIRIQPRLSILMLNTGYIIATVFKI